MRRFISEIARDRSGVTAIEYGLLGALIAMVIIVGVTTAGTSLNSKYSTFSTTLTAAGGP